MLVDVGRLPTWLFIGGEWAQARDGGQLDVSDPATEYGLVSYVYTGDLRRGLAVAGRIESGMVGLNPGLVSDPAAPFGGMKQSGLGREGGHEGMLEFLESKYMR